MIAHRVLALAIACSACGSLPGQTLEPRPLYVEGYTDQLSYVAGDEVALHVSTSAATYSLEIARLAAQREVVLTRSGLEGREYPVPENASSHGCGWPALLTLPIPDHKRSGYYPVALKASSPEIPHKTERGLVHLGLRPQADTIKRGRRRCV